jgi:hypothetical protein
VLNGAVDSNGLPTALSGSGLVATLAATVTPFLISFAAGFDAHGGVDFVNSFATNQTLTLPANSTCFLYVDRDSSTGALTTGYTTLQPTYAAVAPSSPSTGQHWFSTAAYTMSRWSGSAWVNCQRVFVGECVTGVSTISSVVTYAYNGYYQSVWTAVTINTGYNFAHNLGMSISAAGAIATVYSCTTAGTNEADISIASPSFVTGGSSYGYFHSAPAGGSTSRRIASINTMGAGVHYNGSAWLTSGYYMVCVKRGF